MQDDLVHVAAGRAEAAEASALQLRGDIAGLQRELAELKARAANTAMVEAELRGEMRAVRGEAEAAAGRTSSRISALVDRGKEQAEALHTVRC